MRLEDRTMAPPANPGLTRHPALTRRAFAMGTGALLAGSAAGGEAERAIFPAVREMPAY